MFMEWLINFEFSFEKYNLCWNCQCIMIMKKFQFMWNSMVNNFFLSSCAKLGWGHHFSLSFFWHFFFHLRTQKMQFHLSKGFLFFKCQMKKKFKIQNIATSSNCFLLPSLTCNFSRFEKKKLVIIGDYSQNPGRLLFQVFSLLGILLAFISVMNSFIV